MSPAARVSIILPLHNDENSVAHALESCIAQTLRNVEIICVDDASTDRTAAVIEEYRARDSRITLVRHTENRSALQARRTGVDAASAPYALFLDGDDELLPEAAAICLAEAERSDADLVGFAVEVLTEDGQVVGGYQARLAPQHTALVGDDVLAGMFPVGKPAQGQLWRYLFRIDVLREAYDLLPEDLSLPRVNDLPLLFLVAAISAKYVSVKNRLYRYRYGRGGSGQTVDSVERARFYAGAIRSVDSIAETVHHLARVRPNPGLLLDTYESTRLSIIGYVTSYLLKHTSSQLRDETIRELHRAAPATDVVLAALRFYPDSLPALKDAAEPVPLGARPVEHVMLTTRALTTGGVSGVLVTQAALLRNAGYRVTIVARRHGSDPTLAPEGVAFLEMVGRGLPERAQEWAALCHARGIDLIIDHQVLYSRDWPEYALIAQTLGVPTIGWLHNFAGRPSYDMNGLHSLLQRDLRLLSTVVTLSPLDVAFWKLRGIANTVFLPNPPSPLLLDRPMEFAPKRRGGRRTELIWWGRLDEHTKQVTQLLDVAGELTRLDAEFHLTVIGPASHDLTPERFNSMAKARGLQDRIEAVGVRRGDDLIRAIDESDAFVSTSIIEGYQLTIPEAQSRGLPVFMYEMPWLWVVQENDGLVSVPQGDAASLARKIVEVMRSPERYGELSQASREAADRVLAYDFRALYRQVLTGSLPAKFSPEPDLAHAQQLLNWTIFYAEQGALRTGSGPNSPRENNSPRATRAPRAAALSERAWTTAKPIGKLVLQVFPSIRPLAHRVRQSFSSH